MVRARSLAGVDCTPLAPPQQRCEGGRLGRARVRVRRVARRAGAERSVGRGWWSEDDTALLGRRICDLELVIEGTALAARIERLNGELDAAGVRFRPYVWLSTDGFTPDGVTGFAAPFYMAHPRLVRLERRQMLEVEGAGLAGAARARVRRCAHGSHRSLKTAPAYPAARANRVDAAHDPCGLLRRRQPTPGRISRVGTLVREPARARGTDRHIQGQVGPRVPKKDRPGLRARRRTGAGRKRPHPVPRQAHLSDPGLERVCAHRPAPQPPGEIYVLEANPNPEPCFGEDFAEATEAARLRYPDLFQRILDLAFASPAPWRA